MPAASNRSSVRRPAVDDKTHEPPITRHLKTVRLVVCVPARWGRASTTTTRNRTPPWCTRFSTLSTTRHLRATFTPQDRMSKHTRRDAPPDTQSDITPRNHPKPPPDVRSVDENDVAVANLGLCVVHDHVIGAFDAVGDVRINHLIQMLLRLCVCAPPVSSPIHLVSLADSVFHNLPPPGDLSRHMKRVRRTYIHLVQAVVTDLIQLALQERDGISHRRRQRPTRLSIQKHIHTSHKCA